jgi:glutamate-5-semialdehyde dehydrogenase
MIHDIDTIFQNTFRASKSLQRFSDEAIRDLLQSIAREIEADERSILKANQKDVQKMTASDPLVDRLLLNKQRLQAIADSIMAIAELPSPVGKLILKRKMQKGLELK